MIRDLFLTGVVTHTGLATGALLWGCMADRIGRRRTLLTAVTLAAIFDLMAALMPLFWHLPHRPSTRRNWVILVS